MYSDGISSREGTDLSDYVAAMMASGPQQDPLSILASDAMPSHLTNRAAYDLVVEQECQEVEDQRMVVKACKASSTSLEIFAFMKPTRSFVKYCNSLGSNAFGAKPPRGLNRCTCNNHAHLDLSDADLHVLGARELATALRTNTSLKVVNISSNGIGDSGASYIAEALRHNTGMTAITMGGNNIGDEGCTAIAAALCENKTLKFIALGCNVVGPAGATAIAEMLGRNQTLEELYFCNMPIGDEGALAIGKALQRRSALLSSSFTLGGVQLCEVREGLGLYPCDCEHCSNNDVILVELAILEKRRLVLVEKAKAFVMGSHERLGQYSHVVGLDPGLTDLIAHSLLESHLDRKVTLLQVMSYTAHVDISAKGTESYTARADMLR